MCEPFSNLASRITVIGFSERMSAISWRTSCKRAANWACPSSSSPWPNFSTSFVTKLFASEVAAPCHSPSKVLRNALQGTHRSKKNPHICFQCKTQPCFLVNATGQDLTCQSILCILWHPKPPLVKQSEISHLSQGEHPVQLPTAKWQV